LFSAKNIALILAAFVEPAAFGLSHPEVLVVYNSHYTDSYTVASHYVTARNITTPLCSIAPPANDELNLTDYTTYVKTPIQNCLNAAGPKTILYIVMSYLTPYKIYGTGPQNVVAVDSYLADIWDKYATQPFLVIPSLPHPYYADSQSQGNVYAPFQSLAAYRANARNALIYSVWRLDAPTAALASALVDQAMTAEANGGPSGQACIDQQYDPTPYIDASYMAGDWDLYQAASFLRQAGVTVMADSNYAEFGSAPAPATCPRTAFYSGWYSLDNYNDAFTWQTGSIGWHLDSESALDPRGGASWAPNALWRGIAVTSGSVTEPYLEGMVRPGGTFRNLLEGASVGDAFLRNTRWLKWEIMYVGDPLYKPFYNPSSQTAGRPPFYPLQPVNSLQIGPQELVGGSSSMGSIALSAAAPGGGTTFTLNAPGGITVPATVTVPAGATKASFPITTAAVAASQGSIITATSTAVGLQNTIITDPLLQTFTPSLAATMAGIPVNITVLLNGLAPTGGATITLYSDNPAVTVPNTITARAGTSTATFTAGSTPVPSPVTAHVTGIYAGAGVYAGIVVVPAINSMGASPNPVNAGGYTTISVTLGTNVPAGNNATVQLTSSDPGSLPVPSFITVPAGAGVGRFTASSSAGSSGNSVTITATYGGSTATTIVTIN
jgi:uncharacterized protein (TIGR03790 family)